MQENPNAIPEGETPHSVTLFAHDHLVDMAKPGDRITLTGIYKVEGMRVNSRMRMLKSVYKSFIDAIHISRDERSNQFSTKVENDPFSKEQTQQEPKHPIFQVCFLPAAQRADVKRHMHESGNVNLSNMPI